VIACEPCTSKVRARRGWDKVECGIHVTPIADTADPANEPVF
jgi:hypothetical protein